MFWKLIWARKLYKGEYVSKTKGTKVAMEKHRQKASQTIKAEEDGSLMVEKPLVLYPVP